jgi:hypothetical protein
MFDFRNYDVLSKRLLLTLELSLMCIHLSCLFLPLWSKNASVRSHALTAFFSPQAVLKTPSFSLLRKISEFSQNILASFGYKPSSVGETQRRPLVIPARENNKQGLPFLLTPLHFSDFDDGGQRELERRTCGNPSETG